MPKFISPLNTTAARSSIDSISSSAPFSPTLTSSPHNNYPSNREHTRHQQNNSRHNTKDKNSTTESSSDVFDLPKKTNLRIMNINCQSIVNKRAEFLLQVNYIKPDIVFITESWVYGHTPGAPPRKGAHITSEFCPPQLPSI